MLHFNSCNCSLDPSGIFHSESYLASAEMQLANRGSGRKGVPLKGLENFAQTDFGKSTLLWSAAPTNRNIYCALGVLQAYVCTRRRAWVHAGLRPLHAKTECHKGHSKIGGHLDLKFLKKNFYLSDFLLRVYQYWVKTYQGLN